MKKLLAVVCMLALLTGVFTVAGTTAVSAESQYIRAGYSAVSIDPVDKEGTYRTVDYTSIYNGSGNASLKADLNALMDANDPTVSVTKDGDGKVTKLTYTVQTLQTDCDGDGNSDDGYFSVPLGGYGSTDNRLSTGKMDDNGDGKIDSKDGMFVTCIAITDAQNQTVLFFTLDLISSSDFAAASVREKIAAALLAENTSWNVAGSNMLFSASHTHSSPDTAVANSYALPINAAQRAYDELIVDKAIDAAKAAMADRTEVTFSQGQVEATNMNATRHYNVSETYDHYVTSNWSGGKNESESYYREGSWVHGDNFGGSMPSDSNVANSPVVTNSSGWLNSVKNTATYEVANVSESDETLYLVQMTPVSGDKDPIVMVNFRAHPKLNSTSTMGYGKDHKYATSPDYVGALREKLDKYGYRAAYIQGASGNQNTWNYIDDTIFTPGIKQTSAGAAMYSEIMAYREPTVADLTEYNDTKSFFSYTPAGETEARNAQSGFSYGTRLADYVLSGLYNNMTTAVTDGIKTQQNVFVSTAQTYSEGLKAAVAAYDADTSSGKSFPYQYLHTDGKYYNLNSTYHASSVRSRNTDANKIDAKIVINCITIGQLAFLSAPNELYDRYNLSGNQVSDNLWDSFNEAAVSAGYRTPMILGYTNGSEGYIPNVGAYEYNRANNDAGSLKRPSTGSTMIMGVGAYEANTTKFAPGSGEALVDHFKSTLLSMASVERPTTCPMCGATDVQWNAISDPQHTSLNGGHYYLADDLVYYNGTDAYQRIIYGDSCIDLSGHTAGNSYGVNGRAFYVVGGRTLRLMNGTCIGRGSSSNNNGGVIYMEGSAKLYLTDVEVIRQTVDGQTTGSGGAIYATDNCTVDIRGGSVTGGNATTSGGSIYMGKNATLTLKNTTISGGSAKTGGNLYIYTGTTLDMENVTLENGTATGNGDNICSWSAKVHIYGDSVIKGECYFSAGDTATIKFSDNVQAFESPNGENIKLISPTRLTFGTLAETAKISVRGGSVVTDTTGLAYAGKQLVADKGFYLDTTFTNRGIFAGDKWMCECGGMATGKHTCQYHAYAPWTGTESLPTVGNYYLTDNVTTAAQASPNSTYKTLRLDLAGHSITHKVTSANASNTRVFNMVAGTTLVLTDTVGTGSLKRDLSNLTQEQIAAIGNYGTAVCINGASTFRMYGGTIDMQGQSSTGGGAIAVINTTGTVEIYGGTIKDYTCNYGGGIYAKGTVKLLGGTITGCTANGGGIYLGDTAASLTLSGSASVTGNFKKDGVTQSNISASATQLTVSGIYTGTAGITVSSPSVGKVIGISDNADLTNATLTVDNSATYEVVTSGTQLKLMNSANAAVKQTIGNDVVYYESMEQALADYAGGNAYLTLLQDIQTVTLTVPTKIDLAGHDLAAITLESTGSLEIKDSATDDFTVEDADGYGTIPAGVQVQASTGYVLITEGNLVSVHRLDLTLTDLTLRPREVGFYYQSRFGGDEIIKAHMSAFGLSLRAASAPDEAYIQADTEGKTHCEFAGTSWVVGSGDNSAYSVVLTGILKPDNGYIINKRNAEIPVYGVSYVILDGQMILGQSRNYTLRQFLEIVNDQFESLIDVKKNSISSLLDSYQLVMRDWDIDQIGAYWQSKQTEE